MMGAGDRASWRPRQYLALKGGEATWPAAARVLRIHFLQAQNVGPEPDQDRLQRTDALGKGRRLSWPSAEVLQVEGCKADGQGHRA